MHVAVLGCGPAGLTAAWAAHNLGRQVTIASKEWEPSKQYGCQYLHAPIPGFEDVPNVTVKYTLRGTSEQYRHKVYGDKWQGRVSPEDFIGEHQAWDIRETYRRMFVTFEGMIHHDGETSQEDIEVKQGYLKAVRQIGADRIISTIPAYNLCYNNHSFTRHEIYASGDTQQKMFENFIICDGTPEMDWYRVANVFGYRTVEYPAQSDNHPPEAVRVTKPLSTNCNCHPDIIRAGRYGEWDKSVLVHQVYDKVLKALK